MPLSPACCTAVEPEPCILSTSATRARSANPAGRGTSTVRCTPPDGIDTVNVPDAAWPLHALVGSVVGCALVVAAAALRHPGRTTDVKSSNAANRERDPIH